MTYLIRRSKNDSEGTFYWEDDGDRDNAMTAFVNKGGGLTVAVCQVEPQDSYNVMIECMAFLSRSDAVRLRDYLNEMLSDIDNLQIVDRTNDGPSSTDA